MKKNILITGGAGYIGSILVPELLNAGHKVTVVDNFMFDQSSLNHCCSNPNFHIINGDIRHEKFITPYYKSAEIIIPLAGYVGAPLCNKDLTGAQSVNHDALILMLNFLNEDQKVIMPTTNSAYGSGQDNNLCDEESPLNPISKYASDKVAVEQKLMARKNSISFRLATVFGMSPKMRIDLLVNDFVYRAIKDGFIVLYESHFKRNYIHVRDVSSVFVHAIDNFENMRGQIFNVGLSDANISKLELCKRIKLQIKNFIIMEAPMAADPDQRNYVVSNKKIESTGWKPKISLDDGIFELKKGYTMLSNSKYGNV